VWFWLKRWQGSFRDKITRPLLRIGSIEVRDIRFSYEKAGLTIAGEPIPWNAEAVVVEALIRLPPAAFPRKSDFQLLTPDRVFQLAAALYPDYDQDAVRVVFRLPPIQAQTLVAVHYQGGMLGHVLVPFLSEAVFLRALRLRSPTIFALLGECNTACQAVVEGQCRGLSVGGILSSQTSLLPISHADLRVEIADRGTGRVQRLSLPLSASQLLEKEALLSVTLPAYPCEVGTSSIRWMLGDRLLAHGELRVISPATFQQSLYLADARFLSPGRQRPAAGRVGKPSHGLAREDSNGLRPCFTIASREPGVAGLCALEVGVQFCDPNRRPLLGNQEILATDKPARFAPDLTAVDDFRQVRAYELRSNGQLLGTLPVRPTPVAAFTSEGGFHAAGDFDWSPFAEEELADRLEKLMGAGESVVRSP